MKFYGITGKFLNLIKSYLEDRYQKVSIYSNIQSDNISSDWEKITHGVPQGPLLFLIYINDLPEVLIQNVLPILFADDTSIIFTGSDIIDFQLNMKVVFEQLNKWFNVKLLLINFEKKYVSFILKQRMLMR